MGLFSSPPEIADVRLEGKTAIVTGANSGLGRETALDFAKRGAKVIIACRNVEAGEKVAAEIKEESKNENLYVMKLDLGSLQSVKDFVKEFKARESDLHILCNNAGVMAMPRTLSADGYEMQFAVNHLGHFLLTTSLIDILKNSAPSRIVNVSSSAHSFGSVSKSFDDMNLEKSYGDWSAYGRSKTANILFTKELHKRYHDDKISVFTLHPGAVNTNLQRHSFLSSWWFKPIGSMMFTTPAKGALTQIYCSVQPDIENFSGEYFVGRMKKESSEESRNPEVAAKLWTVSEEMIAAKMDDAMQNTENVAQKY